MNVPGIERREVGAEGAAGAVRVESAFVDGSVVVPQAYEIETRFRTLAESMPHMVWEADATGTPVYANERWLEYSGLTLEQSRTAAGEEIQHPEDREGMRATWAAAVASGAEYDTQLRLRRASDGAYRWFHVKGAPVRDRDGRVVRWVGTCTDIQDQKEAEATTLITQERLRLAARAVHGLVYDWDVDTGRVVRTEGLEEIAGVRLGDDEPRASWWVERVHPDDLARVNPRSEAILVGDSYSLEYRVRHEAGHWVHVWDRGTIIRDPNGRPVRVVGYTQDITALKSAEDAAKRSEAAARLQYAAARRMGESLETAGVYAALREIVAEAVPYDGLIVSSFDASTSLARCEYACVGGNELDPAGLPPIKIDLDSGGGMQTQVIRTGRPLLTNEVRERVKDPKGTYYDVDEKGTVKRLPEAGPPKPRAALMVPLKLRGAVIGVVQIMSDRVEYGAEHLELLERIVAQLAPALQNARLYAELRGLLEARTAAEGALRESRALLRAVTDNAPLILSYCTPDYRFRYVNRGYAARFGIPTSEIVGRSIPEILGGAAFASFRPQFDLALAGQELEFETWVPYERLGMRLMHLSYVPDRGADGSVRGVVAVIADVTERRREEAAFAAQSALTRTITENSASALLMVDGEGRCTFMNPAGERMFGWRFEEISRGHLHDLIHHSRPDGSAFPREECGIDGGAAGRGDVRDQPEVYVRSDGSLFPALVSASRICDAEGRVVSTVIEVRDVTVQREQERELAHHRAELERLVLERTAELERANSLLRQRERLAAIGTLSAGIGHDLGNLIMPIRTRLSVVEMDAPQTKPDVDAINAALDYLQKLSAGLRLLATDPERAPKGLEGERTDLRQWAGDVGSLLKTLLPKGVTLVVSVPEGLSGVRMSRAALTQAVFNLVQNACEAIAAAPTKPGETFRITIGARGEEGAVVLVVADNGPGMTTEVLSRCFDPYFSTKGRSISTGMGLGLVRGLVQSAGGSIVCESAPGRGAMFAIRLLAAEVGARGAAPTGPRGA